MKGLRNHGLLVSVLGGLLLFGLLGNVAIFLYDYPPQAQAADDDSSNLIAGSRAQAYQIDRQTALFRTASVADVNSAAEWSAIAEFGLDGRPNINVSARFDGSAGDTCTVKIAYYYKTTTDSVDTLNYKGSSLVLTLTALAGVDANGDNESAVVGFDGRGANMIKLIVVSISAGEIDFWVGSH